VPGCASSKESAHSAPEIVFTLLGFHCDFCIRHTLAGGPLITYEAVAGFLSASFEGGRKSGAQRGRLLNCGPALQTRFQPRKETPMDPTKDNTKSSEENNQPMRFANATLGQHRHVCAFFHDAEEEYRVLLPFVKEGLTRGEKAFHIVDPKLRDEHLERLLSGGIDVPSVEKNRQFELQDWDEVYLRDGHFDRDRMLACMQDVLEQSQRDGFPLARVMGHAEWASGDWPGVDDFLEYECRLNNIIPQYKDAVICLYNLTKCGGNLIIDVIRTHPMILIGGIVQQNPFFVPPDEFLRELRERRASQGKAAA